MVRISNLLCFCLYRPDAMSSEQRFEDRRMTPMGRSVGVSYECRLTQKGDDRGNGTAETIDSASLETLGCMSPGGVHVYRSIPGYRVRISSMKPASRSASPGSGISSTFSAFSSPEWE